MSVKRHDVSSRLQKAPGVDISPLGFFFFFLFLFFSFFFFFFFQKSSEITSARSSGEVCFFVCATPCLASSTILTVRDVFSYVSFLPPGSPETRQRLPFRLEALLPLSPPELKIFSPW